MTEETFRAFGQMVDYALGYLDVVLVDLTLSDTHYVLTVGQIILSSFLFTTLVSAIGIVWRWHND